MHSPTPLTLLQQQLWLSPERVIYWEEAKALILSDLHLGKTGHFRKSGIAVPQQVYKNDLHRLIQSIQHFQPQQLIIVGDMFHSHANKEHDWFLKWRNDLSHIHFHLVEGNHDILDKEWYQSCGLELHTGTYTSGPFSFTHDSTDTTAEIATGYRFSGHLHPGVLMRGLGKQSLRFPCFYFGKEESILPAFGGFTGLALVDPQPGDKIFAIVENSLIAL